MTSSPLVAVRQQFGVVRYIWGHPSNQGQQFMQLSRAFAFQARARLFRKRGLALIGDRSHMWVDLHRTAATRVLYSNPPDRAEMLVWRRHLQRGDLFIDVGANVGAYTLWAAEGGAAVIALEPAADTFGLLAENVALNGYEVTLLNKAAGETTGTSRFTTGLDAVNRMDPDGEVEVETVRLDDLIGDRRAAGIKIDVEGFEEDVLRGCRRALSEHRVALLQVEWNSSSLSAKGTAREPVAEILRNAGYGLFRPTADGILGPPLGTIPSMDVHTDVFAQPLEG